MIGYRTGWQLKNVESKIRKYEIGVRKLNDDLKFYINLKINNVPRSYTARIVNGSKGNQLQLDRISNSFTKDEEDAFNMFTKIPFIKCHADDGKDYAFYNLTWLGTRTSFGQHNIVLSITLSFQDLIQSPTEDNSFNSIIFSFDHIDEIFGRTSYDTQFPLEENKNEIKITLKVPDQLSVTLDDETKISFFSEFYGLVSSYTLYDLNVKQTKRVQVIFPNRINYERIYDFIVILKLYFEFVYNCTLGFKELVLIDDTDNYRVSNIMVSKLINIGSFGSPVFKSRYKGTSEELTQKIKIWFELYNNFEESILIWKKSIYNTNVDRDDKFLWLCQSFESMCQHDHTVYLSALKNAKVKNPKISYPNLSDYLLVVEDIIDFKFTNRSKYYKNVVKVRDKLTHNNPDKKVTEMEKDESYRLIDYFHLSFLVSKLGGLKISKMISLP